MAIPSLLTNSMTITPPKIHVSTLFYWCNDIAATRNFYANLIGLEETYYDEQAGWFTCQSNSLNLVFMRATNPLPLYSEWAKQPGYHGGTLEAHSQVLTVPTGQFQTTVARLINAGVPCFQEHPSSPQPGHWQFIVKDPMGITVEIYSEPE
jgi:catechol 2,3-dioxygenase-like lactoylglutathione lyase family enzyme